MCLILSGYRHYSLNAQFNHHGAQISVIWLLEGSAIKLLILVRY